MSTWQKSSSLQRAQRKSVAAATYLRAAEHGCPASFPMIQTLELDRGWPGS